MSIQTTKQKGYSLIELMIVLVIILVVSAITVSRLYSSSSDTGGAERVIDEASARVVERRSDALRLNGEDHRTGLTNVIAEPLPIDFGNLPSTASIKIEGNDANGDCIDDQTGSSLTCLQNSGGTGKWIVSLNEDALKLPTGWQVAQASASLGNIPLIGNGSNGRGILVTSIGFDANGNALAQEPGSTTWRKYPTGSSQTATPAANDAPFWAVYFVASDSSTGRDSQGPINVKAAVAVAIHPSGLIERFRFDGADWIGFQNRTVR